MALGIYFVIEQPLSSILFSYRPVREALQRAGACRVSFQLLVFGASSSKPLALHGTAPWLYTLEIIAASLVKPTKRVKLSSSGPQGWTGNKLAMGISAEYTADFCKLVARLHGLLLQELGGVVGEVSV